MKQCIDTLQELESCGGCVGNGGVNCLELPGLKSETAVACVRGQCAICRLISPLRVISALIFLTASCKFGYRLNSSGSECEKMVGTFRDAILSMFCPFNFIVWPES